MFSSETMDSFKQFLYEVEVHIPKVQICTKFPCSFYIGAAVARERQVKSNESVRAVNSQLAFTQPLKLQTKIQQTDSNQLLSKKMAISLYIRSDSNSVQQIVAGFLKLDLSHQINNPASSQPRKYSFDKCPDRSNSLFLSFRFKCLGEIYSSGNGPLLFPGVKIRESSGSQRQSESTPSLKQYFAGAESVQPEKTQNVTGRSFLKKKLSIQGGSLCAGSEQYWTPKNNHTGNFTQHFKKCDTPKDSLDIISNPKPYHRTDSIDCARVSSTGSSAGLHPNQCPRCALLQHQIVKLIESHRIREAQLKHIVLEVQEEVRRYALGNKDKVDRMQVELKERDELVGKLRRELDEEGKRYRREVEGRDREVQMLYKRVQEIETRQFQKVSETNSIQYSHVKYKSETFLPGLLQQISKTLDSQQNICEPNLQSSILLMDRNKDLLDTIAQLKDDRFRLVEALKHIIDESEDDTSRKVCQLITQHTSKNLLEEQ